MTTETITWNAIADRLPDVDETVLIYSPGWSEPVWMGWWDGECWRADDGWPMHESPACYWAEIPKGPTT